MTCNHCEFDFVFLSIPYNDISIFKCTKKLCMGFLEYILSLSRGIHSSNVQKKPTVMRPVNLFIETPCALQF